VGGDTDEPVSLDDEAHAWWAAPDDVGTAASEPPDETDETDPYVVLGIPPTASWDEITGAHRRLAKEHHPDRLVDPTPEERERSDDRIRDLNIAYMELRRRKGR